MSQKTSLIIAKAANEIAILPSMANRHGLIAGATGTGKTVTLRVLAEQFSRIGVPVFMADVKGDLSGMAKPGGDRPEFADRAKQLGVDDFAFEGCPTVFWDVFGQQGHPVRTTISEMGPLLLSRILNLNDVQSGVLTLIFKIADDNGLLLLDLKDLRAMTPVRRRQRRASSRPSTATSRPQASARSSAACSPSRSRAAAPSSANRP